MGLNHTDLESAVKALNTFVDVQEDELVEITTWRWTTPLAAMWR